MNGKLIIGNLLERIGFSRSESVGLALSGGGARGFAHIGVFMAFESFGIRPDILSGVSAGSIAAVLYGAGLTPEEIEECFMEADGMGDFTQWSLPKEGFLKLTRFSKLLESWLPVRNLEELQIPTVVCATNFDKGSSVGWLKGEIVPRVIASCSIPIVFQPVKINGEIFVDGGVLRNLPAWAIRKYCSTLYGSNCSPLEREFSYKESLLEISLRSFQLMMKANTLQDINLCDYLISPRNLAKKKTFDLENIHETVMTGYDAACKVLENSLK